jgi:hypothetical protein
MLLILAFNKAFIKDMESKDLFTVDNLIVSLRLAADATEAVANIIMILTAMSRMTKWTRAWR